jgi:prepilin-type N-terminal cleavage/methylation domain-containing protein
MVSHPSPPYAARLSRDRGFTLIELAMVLFIISLTLVGLFATATTLIRQSEDKETKEKVIVAKERIQGFASSNQRLPEYASGGGVDELTSLLPNSRDFWGRKLTYIYDRELAKSTTGLPSTLCAKKTTGIQIKNCPDVACGPGTFSIQQNIAYVIFSTGRNLLNQTGAATTTHTEVPPDPSYSGPDGSAGAANVRTITMYPQGSLVGPHTSPAPNLEKYQNDDVVLIVTLDELRSRLSCQGTPLRIVNSDLPMGAASTTYLIAVYADGGIPVDGGAGKYRWCAETSLTAATTPTLTNFTNMVALEAMTGATATNVPLGAAGSCLTIVESAWASGDTMQLRGRGASNALASVTSAGTYDVTIYARDDQSADATALATANTDDNIIFRKFVLAVSGP